MKSIKNRKTKAIHKVTNDKAAVLTETGIYVYVSKGALRHSINRRAKQIKIARRKDRAWQKSKIKVLKPSTLNT